MGIYHNFAVLSPEEVKRYLSSYDHFIEYIQFVCPANWYISLNLIV